MTPTVSITPLTNPPIELALALPASFKPAACVIVAPSSHPATLASVTGKGALTALFVVGAGETAGFLKSRAPGAYLAQQVPVVVMVERMGDAERIRQAMSSAKGRA